MKQKLYRVIDYLSISRQDVRGFISFLHIKDHLKEWIMFVRMAWLTNPIAAWTAYQSIRQVRKDGVQVWFYECILPDEEDL